MSEASTRRSSVGSPYVSLREAVRPAIFAYSILASERDRAEALAVECDNLLQLTRELLKKVALTHLLTPEFGEQAPTDADGAGDRQAELLDAYADAGLLWAKVVGSCMGIASVLLEQEEWAKVNHLGEVLAAVGETASATELSRRVLSGPQERASRIIINVHSAMSAEEIREALYVLRKWSRLSSLQGEPLGLALTNICRSAVKLFPSAAQKNVPNIKHLAKEGCQDKDVGTYLPYISNEFSKLQQQEA